MNKNRSYTVLTLMLSAALLALLSAGCTHDPHDIFDGGAGDRGEDSGRLAAELVWKNQEDGSQDNAISDIRLLISGSDGTVGVQSYSSPQEVSAQCSRLPSGACRLFATVNMTEANGYLLNDGAETRAGASSGSITVSLAQPGVLPAAQSWFGIGEATIEAGQLSVVSCELHRTVPSLSIRVTGVPAGTSVSVSLQRVADSITLDVEDDEGGLGVPSTTYSTVSLGQLSAAEGDASSLVLPERCVFPTAYGCQRTYLDIYLTDPAGETQHAVADAPAMLMGHSYSAEIEYGRIAPYMYLDSCTISDWEEGWTVAGSVLDPDER